MPFSYIQPRSETESRSIVAIVSELAGDGSVFEVPCPACIETAADKFSALTWRVIKHDRGADDDDPAMIRHLHDLFALKGIVDKHADGFTELVVASFEVDMQSGPRRLEKGLPESANDALEITTG